MKPKAPKPPRDTNANVHRIFEEMIERSEKPPNRGNLRSAPTAKKSSCSSDRKR
jgi:hypothetical protein